MRLKALEVQGFKTFPDKTKLNFTEGITAVVGPNGSGKSNISDAIRWVLGEQSAKTLRCSKMEDVIFNGTKQRKKTGYAQVTLSFDNKDRQLQYDGDEVAVTRRYYRSGNSEYLINNAAVRLQDIHELFMDTGLGRDGYSMIGQGKIDSVVATKGEDRREIFEEAAGISKFRYKKSEAERRLAKAEENLVRLRDILSELEGRVEPLRIQSEKAKAFITYDEEKRGLEIALWLRTLDKSASAVKEQEDKLAVANAQYNDVESSIGEIAKEIEESYSRQNDLTIKIEELRQNISEKEEKSAEKRSEVSVLKNDIRHNEETAERIQNDIAELSKSGEELKNEIEEKSRKIEKLNIVLSQQKVEENKYTEELLQLRTGESDSADKIAKINSALAELTGKASDAKIEYMTASSSINELTGRTEVLENTIKAKKSQITTLKNIISDYEEMKKDCENNASDILKSRDDVQQNINAKRMQYAKLKEKTDQMYLSAQQLLGKARMLEDLERNLEGFAHSVKIIMREAKKGTLSGICGPVSRVIKTDAEYNTAIEIALGAAMQNIVTENDSDAKRAITYLKQHDGGRATFLPMSSIKGRELNESGLRNCDGFVGIAAELCTCEDCYKGILLNLLGRTVVAVNLDRAVDIAKKYGYRFRIVTLDGQVVNAGGSLTGGSLLKNAGLLGRAGEIESLKKQSAATLKKADELSSQLKDEDENIARLEKDAAELSEQLSVSQGDKIKLEAEIRSRQTELDSTKTALVESEKERENSAAKMNELTIQMENARNKLDVYRKEISENEEIAGMLTGSKDELVKKREELSEKLQQIKIEILTTEKDIDAAKTEIENAILRKNTAQERIITDKDEINVLLKKNEELLNRICTLEKEADELKKIAVDKKNGIETFTSEKLMFEQKSAQLRQKEREKQTEREAVSGEIARLEERRVNLQKQYDDTVNKLWEEYNLTRREAEETAVEIDDPSKAQRRLNELKQKIKSLGTVNVSAIEEYKEVSERYEFLSTQTGDVEKSRNELLHLINDLTKQMREIFIERFNQINKNFSETFVELFGGGKASLSLSDPENVLTTGIEISVEPPGKIVSHIELLSGGEKALVAIALYFAIMKVRPSPFCVMDEIEAALDDVNVYRFAEYLRRMNDKTQFICITHRRGTMEEADVLYGVTMQDQGISKLLELKASEIEQKLGMKA